MTTIAYDGQTVAGDSRMVASNVIQQAEVNKIFPLQHSAEFHLCGGGGVMSKVIAFRNWIESGISSEFPGLISSDEFDSELFAIDHQGLLHVFERCATPIMITDQLYAIGSGADFALGAMANGSTARDAVRIAKKFDPWTGGKVKSFVTRLSSTT